MFKKLNNSYLIAEAGVNHEGQFDLAMKQIKLAKEGGASAIKFQIYKAEKLASKTSPAYWDQSCEPTSSQFELFKKFDKLEKNEYIKLSNYCKEINIDFCATPFDIDSLDWLIPLVPFVKIASADITNYILIDAICKYEKPVIISAGASSLNEIEEALKLMKNLNNEICLMHCVLNYPTKKNNAFLSRIKLLQNKFGDQCTIGYSDHVSPNEANDDQILIARGMGVKVFEKHFTHNKNLKGNDHYHAMDISNLNSLTKRLEIADKLISDGYTEIKFLEEQSDAIKNARRSLYYSNNLNKGHILTKNDVIAKRPGHGIPVKELTGILEQELSSNVSKDDLIKYEHFVEK